MVAALQRAVRPGQTLLLVTHKPAMLKLVDRLVILTPGGIALDGPRDEVLQRLQGKGTNTAKTAAAEGVPA